MSAPEIRGVRAAVAVLTGRERRRVEVPEAAVAAGQRALDVAAEARWAVADGRVSRVLTGLVAFTGAAAVAAAFSASPVTAPHVPAFLLVMVGAVAAARGRDAGAVAGFTTGLAADIFVSTPLGLGALIFTVVGHTVGRTTVSARDPHRRRIIRARAVMAASGGSLALAAAGRVFAAGPPARDTVREAAAGALLALLALLAGPVAFAVAQQRRRR